MSEHEDFPDRPSGANGGDDGQSLIGLTLYDAITRVELGHFRQAPFDVTAPGPALGPSPSDFPAVSFIGPDGRIAPLPRGEVLVSLLGGFVFARVSNEGIAIDVRRPSQSELERLGLIPPRSSTGGGGGSSGVTFGQQQALTEQDFQNQLRFLEAQEKAARERFDYESAANFQNQIELLKLNQSFATGERIGSQEFATGERIGSQEFTAAENELSRENSLRLQKLQEAGSLRRQVLDLQARGRELRASLIGKDPFRSAALAQGLTPTRGTPADLLGGELDALIRRPVPQPASMSISDINTTLEELTQTAGAGLPSTGGFGIAALAHGGVINMRKDEDGVFSPTVLGNSARRNPPTIRSAAHGGTFKRPGRRRSGRAGTRRLEAGGRSGIRPSDTFQVLVGESRGDGKPNPELLTISPNEIQVTPVITAADGRRIQWPASGAGGGAGRSLGPLSNVTGDDEHFTDILDDLPGGGGTISPTTPPGVRPTQPDPGPIIRPIVGPVPRVPPRPAPPDFEPSPTAITQALASIYSRLGFDQIPTFREGPFGGMQLPAGTLASDTFSRLGVADPSLVRLTFGPSDDPSQIANFWRSPQGQFQLISQFAGGPNLLDAQARARAEQAIIDAGFGVEDFVTTNFADPAAAYGLPDFFGPTGTPAPFEGQDILRDVSPTAWPLRRAPIAFRPTDAQGDFANEQGFFLPSPRALASIYRTSDAATQAAILSAWETAFVTQDQALGAIDWFTPQGSFAPSQVAGFA